MDNVAQPFSKLGNLPDTLPREGAIAIDLQDGIPILRASASVQERIEILLDRQREDKLTPAEVEELDLYEEMDDYLSLLNRVARNSIRSEPPVEV